MEGTEKQGAEVDYKVNISNPPQAEQTQPEETLEVQAEEQVQAEGNEEQVQEQEDSRECQIKNSNSLCKFYFFKFNIYFFYFID